MKKEKLSVLVIATLVLIGLTTTAPAQEKLTAVVIEAAGRVGYVPGGTSNILPVKALSTRLVEGDILVTGPASRAKLRIEGKTVPGVEGELPQSEVEIGYRSRVRINELFADVSTGGEAVQLGVGEGQIISNVRRINPNSERFEVQTPTVVAAVRGTHFGTDVKWRNRQPLVKFRVLRGGLNLLDQVRSPLGSLNEGQVADIEPTGAVSVSAAQQPAGQKSGGIDGRSGVVGGASGEDGDERETISAPSVDPEGDDTGGRE